MATPTAFDSGSPTRASSHPSRHPAEYRDQRCGATGNNPTADISLPVRCRWWGWSTAGQNGTVPRSIATLLSWTGGVVWTLLLALGIVLAGEVLKAHREQPEQRWTPRCR